MICKFSTKAERAAACPKEVYEFTSMIHIREFTCLSCAYEWVAPKAGLCPKCYSEKLESKARTDKDE